MIRARCKDDLRNLAKKLYGFCDESQILEIKHADYRYRMKVTKVLWSEYLAECALDLDYSNVKDNIIPEGDYERHEAYFQVWQTLFRWQSNIEANGRKKAVQAVQIMRNVGNADLAEIRQALTYCFRHQRWTESWAPVIDRRKENATVIDLLKRLREIRKAIKGCES